MDRYAEIKEKIRSMAGRSTPLLLTGKVVSVDGDTCSIKVGDIHKTGTIVISYCRGFRDTMRALVNDFRKASEQLQIVEYTKPKFCVGEWLENAQSSSLSELDNPDALAVFGDKEWAMDWRPYLIDMTAVEGETKKRPVMELKKTIGSGTTTATGHQLSASRRINTTLA